MNVTLSVWQQHLSLLNSLPLFSVLTPPGPALSSDPSSHCTCCPHRPRGFPVCPVNQHSPAHHAQWAADRYFIMFIRLNRYLWLENLCHTLINVKHLLHIFLSNVILHLSFPCRFAHSPSAPLLHQPLPQPTHSTESCHHRLQPCHHTTRWVISQTFKAHVIRSAESVSFQRQTFGKAQGWQRHFSSLSLSLSPEIYTIVFTPFQEKEKGLPQLD